MRISQRLAVLGDSPTLAVDARSKEMIRQGRPVISLALGEPDFPTPPHIVEAAIAAMHRGETRYTPTPGTPELRRAIAEKTRRDNNIPLEAADVVVSAGAKHSLFNAFEALLEPGDEVLVPLPCWVSYPPQIALAEGVLVPVPTSAGQGFRVDGDLLREKIGPRTRVILLNSPSNPTGACLTRADVTSIAELACERDLTIVSDEIYEDLVYEGERPVSPASLGPEVAARTVTINGVSKSYAMTGWRIGWAMAKDRGLVQAMTRLQSHSTSNACSVAQAAALAALTSPRDFQEDWRREFDRRRRRLVEGLNALPGVSCLMPAGAFYAFPDVSAHLGPGRRAATDTELALQLLEEAEVATVPGSAFEAPGHLRLSYALAYPRLEEALTRLTRFFQA
ncbi:MAG: pyridoxal phosphate-dependent aminotransferase [Myxococcota bacterium]|jgi:aspartate aminotransferase|nr:pyridoxal phosphate-dependent aminotransferase [Myxococcota bacterium]